MVPDVTVDNDTITINGNIITLTLSWGEIHDDLNPIVNYTVSCLGDVTCPPDFTTIDNTTTNYTITNLAPMTNYTFSVVATNSIGSGEAGIVMIITPGKVTIHNYTALCLHTIYVHIYVFLCNEMPPKLYNLSIHFHCITSCTYIEFITYIANCEAVAS